MVAGMPVLFTVRLVRFAVGQIRFAAAPSVIDGAAPRPSSLNARSGLARRSSAAMRCSGAPSPMIGIALRTRALDSSPAWCSPTPMLATRYSAQQHADIVIPLAGQIERSAEESDDLLARRLRPWPSQLGARRHCSRGASFQVRIRFDASKERLRAARRRNVNFPRHFADHCPRSGLNP